MKEEMIPENDTGGEKLPPDTPTTLHERLWRGLWRVKQCEQSIFVREQDHDGKWRAISLADMTPERRAFHVARWLEEDCRVLPPDAIRETPKAKSGS